MCSRTISDCRCRSLVRRAATAGRTPTWLREGWTDNWWKTLCRRGGLRLELSYQPEDEPRHFENKRRSWRKKSGKAFGTERTKRRGRSKKNTSSVRGTGSHLDLVLS